MNRKRLSLSCLVILACLFACGCLTIEQEVFLNPDGSGELVLNFSMPDFPEDMAQTPLGAGPKKNPADEMKQFQKELTTGLPPAVKLKEVKEVRQNGSAGFYAVFQFKDLKDLEPALANLGKGSLKQGEIDGKSQWKVQLEKVGNKTVYTGRFFLDMPEKKADKDEKPASADATKGMSDDLEKQLMPLFLGMIKMRFVLHAPSPITETNADIVLHEKTAVWNCSLITFLKDKKPVEMRAAF